MTGNETKSDCNKWPFEGGNKLVYLFDKRNTCHLTMQGQIFLFHRTCSVKKNGHEAHYKLMTLARHAY